MDIKNQAVYQNKYLTKILVAVRKSKVTLNISKPAFVRMCILDLSKV